MRNRHLWLRISAADLPDGFGEKLREEFGWSHKDSADAIEEYRRFVYLNQVADHPLSPPREVDLVWHVHLLYTRHYWGAWRKMLDTDLHHEPAKAGTAETAFWEPYGNTRALYLDEFGDFGAEAIWPSVETLKRNEWAGRFALICFIITFVAGVMGAVSGNSNLIIVAVIAFACFFIGMIFAASKSSGRGSFGISTGSGGDGGCGD